MVELIEFIKDFGKVLVVDRLLFRIEKGEIFGILGENGVGKIIIFRMFVIMLKLIFGIVIILGFDIIKEFEKVR